MVQINDIVQARYNSGEYIGRVLEERGNFFLVEVLAVLKHPQQGDLHHLGEVDGVAFHERKALAFREKFNARKRTTKCYDGDVPSYEESLKKALDAIKQELTERNDEFGKLSLERIADLERDFYNKILTE